MTGLLTALASVQADPGFWMPFQGSSSAPAVDRLFHFIFWLSLFFFVLIVALTVVFVVRFRRRRGVESQPSPSHNTALELTWTLIPLALVIVIFGWGFKLFLDIQTPPANSYEVMVTGMKWKWLFTYPNGHVDENLHVPVEVPVRLVMTSEDVIHSFYVPAFRLKRDVVPGRYAKTWFRATAPGEYQVFCAEYCGTSHSDMLAKVVVHEPGGFEQWLESASDLLKQMPPAQAGEKLVASRGCAQCHSADGKAMIGPSFKGLFGHQQPLRGGGTATVDEDYVRESILAPAAKVALGYEPVMPTYKGRLSDQEITGIIEYLKTLATTGDRGPGSGDRAAPDGAEKKGSL